MEINENIISWYPFKINDKVLIVSLEKENKINNFFVENKINFDCLELRNNNEFKDLKQISFNDKYDCIIILGAYEYTPLFFKSLEPYSDLLKYLKNFLNENGKIILAVDNKFGVKYFSGCKSEHYLNIFGSLLNNLDYKKSNLISKYELLKIISDAGFTNYKFYYPLPNYREANSIFTDSFLPDESNSKLLYNVCSEGENIVLFNEIELIKQFSKDKLFDVFCNSYLVELSIKEDINNIKFVSFNDFRKEKYQLQLVIDNDVVIKTPKTQSSKQHLENLGNYIKKLNQLGFNLLDYMEDNQLKSKFVSFKQFDKILVNELLENNEDIFYKKIEEWYKYLNEKLLLKSDINFFEKNIFKDNNIVVDSNFMEKMHFIKDGSIDLAFENTFIDSNGKYLFYDQEWYLQNVPIEFILYRALNNFWGYNQGLINDKIQRIDLLKKFKIDNFVEYFQSLEKILQNNIIDYEKINCKTLSIISLDKLIKENNELLADNNSWRENFAKLESEKVEILKNYNELYNNYKKLEDKYAAIVDSRSYKIMQKLKGNKND